jgi:hypothetical protein
VKRLLTGELRQGALAGLMVDAVTKAAGVLGSLVRRALMLSGDLTRTAEVSRRGRAPTDPRGTPVRRGAAGSQPPRSGAVAEPQCRDLAARRARPRSFPSAGSRAAGLGATAAPCGSPEPKRGAMSGASSLKFGGRSRDRAGGRSSPTQVVRGLERIGSFDYFRRRSRAAGLPAHHPFPRSRPHRRGAEAAARARVRSGTNEAAPAKGNARARPGGR